MPTTENTCCQRKQPIKHNPNRLHPKRFTRTRTRTHRSTTSAPLERQTTSAALSQLATQRPHPPCEPLQLRLQPTPTPTPTPTALHPCRLGELAAPLPRKSPRVSHRWAPRTSPRPTITPTSSPSPPSTARRSSRLPAARSQSSRAAAAPSAPSPPRCTLTPSSRGATGATRDKMADRPCRPSGRGRPRGARLLLRRSGTRVGARISACCTCLNPAGVCPCGTSARASLPPHWLLGSVCLSVSV
jgi:hypothetical protein